MGQVITFCTTKDEKSLGNFFEANYNDFRKWCIDKGDYVELLSVDSQDFLIENEILPVSSELSRDILDDLVSHYLSIYCGIVNTDLLEIRNPIMKRNHYEEAEIEIEQKCSKKALELWNYLLKGRTLLDGSEIAVSNTSARVGYWTVYEQNYLLAELKKIFGKVSTINGIRFVQQVLEELVPDKTELIICA
jgi:hypothetical protein